MTILSTSGLTARRRRLLALAACLALGAASRAGADPLLTYPLRIKGHTIRVELADSPETRRTGLMHRRQMGESNGMLFIFEEPSPQAMWMKNTLIPLSVAFIRADGRILNIEDMQPLTEDAHASSGDALFAIEMNLGWFRKRGIAAGDRVEGMKDLLKQRK
jgi:hypothetical protein